MTNIASKDILARLLAAENITVAHKQAQTASFNVRDRVLTLPMWDNMQSDTYDHLVGHEVGHALYTPEAGWHESASSKGKIYRQYLNIVEDARIEKMVQARYPGLRRSFISSYKRMLADGFFGGDITEINRYSLIDRINTYFKAGRSAGVRIEADEMVWVKKIEKLETWDEVVALTDDLFEFCKERAEEEAEDHRNSQEEMRQQDEDEFGDESDDEDDGDFWNEDEDDTETDGDGDQDGESEEGEPEEGEQDGDSGADYSEDEDEDDTDEEGQASNGAGGDPAEELMSSKTDDTLRRSISAEHGDDESITVTTLKLPTHRVDDIVIKSQEIVDMFEALPDNDRLKEVSGELLKKFMVNNKPAVNYMAKEFEMKKSAAEYARQTVSKTGVIDPIKMNSYRYNDDIFKKMSITPDGKNHGMLMYIDWSGSMCEDISATIDQLLNLVLFCRQVNIPFRVYAFTDRFSYVDADSPFHENNVPVDSLMYDQGFRLMEFFTSDMNRRKFTEMAEYMLAMGNHYKAYYGRGPRRYVPYSLPNRLTLGSTPLNESIMAAFQIHGEFKKKTRVDIVNTLFLTDGESNSSYFRDAEYGTQGAGYKYNHAGTKVLYITNPLTNKRTRVRGSRDNMTKVLLDMYRETTGSTTIGYRIMPNNRRLFVNSLPSAVCWDDGYELYASVRKEKYAVITNAGYDQLYFIAGGKNLQTANGAIEVERGDSKRSVRTAFKKANSDKKSSRKMLSDLIDAIA